MYEKVNCNYTIRLDAETEPIYRANPGSDLKVETVNAYGEHFSNMNELKDLISRKYGEKHHHPLTGPIEVSGAEPGDVLRVDIHGIRIGIMGQALSRSAGIDPIAAEFFGDRAPIISEYDSNAGNIKYFNGMHIPFRPMLGMIGTAPSTGYIKTGHAGKTGGNLDIPFVTEKASIYIPVQVPGAMLYLGDAHGIQGYGELGGVALEASAWTRMSVDVLKPRKPFNSIVIVGKEPVSGREALGIVGVAEKPGELNLAVLDAYRAAIPIVGQLFPAINSHAVCNLITAIGHSMNGQAFSKTSESTSIINIYGDDLAMAMHNRGFRIAESFEPIFFER